jgi:hypothetical protein
MAAIANTPTIESLSVSHLVTASHKWDIVLRIE